MYKGLNNAIDVSHGLTEKQEKIFGRIKSQHQAQRFLFAFKPINTILQLCRYKTISNSYRHARADAFSFWQCYIAGMAV